jgi:hypothetical protein
MAQRDCIGDGRLTKLRRTIVVEHRPTTHPVNHVRT